MSGESSGGDLSWTYDNDFRVTGLTLNGGARVAAETDASGKIVSLFVYGTSAWSPDYMVKDGVTYRFIRDVQGSVRLVVNADSGAVAQRVDYDSFGRVLADTSPGFQPFGFQSGLYDPDTALVQFGARWYDAASGRWLSKDPILLEGGFNLYAFCGNDPVNFADPDGLDTYKINRKLGGDEARAKGNPVSHTFYAVQHQDGTIETYGWGSEFDANNNGLWSKNLPQDIKAATEAINNGEAWLKGDSSLDPFIEQAYNQIRGDDGSKHRNWWIANNCKWEGLKLNRLARKMQSDSAK